MVRMTDAVLPVRWACPGTPAPAPTGPLHTGQSDSQPEWHTNLQVTVKISVNLYLVQTQ